MKNILLLLTLLFFCIPMDAQTKYFEKSFGWVDVHSGSKIHVINDTSYLMIGDQLSLENFKWEAFSLFLNQYGAIINQHKYTIHEELFAFDFAKSNQTYGLGGCSQITEDTCVMSMIITDFQGNEKSIKLVAKTTEHSVGRTMLATKDNGFLLGGHILNDFIRRELYLIRTDSEGNKLWEKRYPLNTSHNHTIRDILPANDGGYYLLGTTNLNFNTDPQKGDIILMKIDEEGEKEWQKTYNLGEVDQAWEFVATIDGGFLLAGAINYGEPAFIKLDADFEVEWTAKDIFPDCGTDTIIQLEDGNYVAVGCYKTESGDTRNDVKLVKLDGRGAVLWERAFGGERHDYAYDMICLEDGSFLISGRTESGLTAPDANVYLIKTNCMGLLTEPLASFSAEQDSEHELTYHFTNLSEFVYPDSIDGGHFIWDFGDGVTSNELHPSHEYLDKGESYIASLTAVVCSDTSRLEVKVVAGDEIVNIEELEGSLPAFSFKLFPNPASSELRLEYDLPREGVFELFDLPGRLINNFQLSINNSEMDLDIRYLESGLYLYRLSLEGRTLEDGKLVVE